MKAMMCPLQFTIIWYYTGLYTIFPDNELYYTGAKDGVKKKVVLTIEEIKEISHHHHSNPMGGHSGVNATLQKISNYYYGMVWKRISKNM